MSHKGGADTYCVNFTVLKHTLMKFLKFFLLFLFRVNFRNLSTFKQNNFNKKFKVILILGSL